MKYFEKTAGMPPRVRRFVRNLTGSSVRKLNKRVSRFEKARTDLFSNVWRPEAALAIELGAGHKLKRALNRTVEARDKARNATNLTRAATGLSVAVPAGFYLDNKSSEQK